MREVSFFWKIDRLDAIGLKSIAEIARRIEFLSYIKRAPKDIRCLFKFHLHDGQKIENLEKPIACRAPNSFMRNENAANNVFNPPIMAPIEIRNAETHAIQRIGV